MDNLTLRPGDILVVRYNGVMSDEVAKILREQADLLLAKAGLDNPVMVVDNNVTIDIIRKES